MNREGGSTNAIPIITAVCAEQGTATESRNDAMYLSREEFKPGRADSAAVVQPSPVVRGSRLSAESRKHTFQGQLL